MAGGGGTSTIGRAPVEALLVRVGIREHVARLLAATPSLRLAWGGAVAVALAFAVLAARAGPRGVVLFLALAPLLPVAGVALAFGPHADPAYEVTQAAPMSSFRLLLLRAAAVLATTTLLAGAASLTLPALDWRASAWLLPSLALTVAGLALSTFVPPLHAAATVAGLWAGGLILAANAADSALAAFRGPAQVGFFVMTAGGSAVVAWRRERFEIEQRARRREVIAAHDAARRRLERDLHDGAQQQVVAIAVKLHLARTLAKRDRDGLDELLAQLEADAQEALETLRELSRGSQPQVLRERGLVAALEARAARSPVPVAVSARAVGRYPAEIESAVYFCCMEAIQNAVKHARGSRVRVHLEDGAGELSFLVTDDGIGFDARRARSSGGLRNLADRVEALGGRFECRSEPGKGTTISGTIPWKAVAGLPGGRPDPSPRRRVRRDASNRP